MANQITIGRNPQNTIVVDAQYNTVSGSHATISRNGNTLTFEDHSTNGSYINGQKVHHSSITIQQGDIITLGHQYTLNMNDVIRYLGGSRDTQRTPQVPGTAREFPTPIVRQEETSANKSNKSVKQPTCLHKFNWMYSFLGFVVGVILFVVFVNILADPYRPAQVLWAYVPLGIGIVGGLYYGAIGNKKSWQNSSRNANDFDAHQQSLNIIGAILSGIVIIAFICFIALVGGFVGSLL